MILYVFLSFQNIVLVCALANNYTEYFVHRAHGKSTDGILLDTIHSKSELDCTINCVKTQRCTSVNFRQPVCEILEGATSDMAEFLQEEGWLHIYIDFCISNPCAHGGTCVNDANGFHCACADHFNGTLCEVQTCQTPRSLICEEGRGEDAQVIAPRLSASTTAFQNSELSEHDHGVTQSCLYNLRSDVPPKVIGAWCAALHDIYQWIEADLGDLMRIMTVQTQGRANTGLNYLRWVSSYKLSIRNDTQSWVSILNQDGTERVFDANFDTDTVVENDLPDKTLARYIKLHPQTWQTAIQMRWEVKGCNAYL